MSQTKPTAFKPGGFPVQMQMYLVVKISKQPIKCTCSLASQESNAYGVLLHICVKESPWQHLSTFGRFQSNSSGGWRSQQLYTLSTSFVKINSQVKRRHILIDIPVLGKAEVWACISLQHLDGRHKPPGVSLVMELFFHFPTPSPGKHCIARGGAGAAFPSAVKMEMLEPLHSGLSQETASSRAPLDHCPLWQRPVCEMCACLLLAAGLFLQRSTNAYPESTVSGLLSAESLLWSKCLRFQTPSRPVYSFSTWLQDKSVLAVSKGVNAFSKILSETMRIGGTPNPNILLIYAVRAAGKLDILQKNWLSPPAPLHCSFFSLKSAAMEWVNYFLGQLLCNIQYFILWAHKNKHIKKKKVASCSVFQRIGQLQRFHVCFLGMC